MRCKNTAKKIASFIPESFDGVVIEIGPGTGSLTEFLVEQKNLSSIIGIEIEKDSCEYLREKFSDIKKFSVLEKDFNQINNLDFLEGSRGRHIFIGNLPYNRAAQIIFHCLENFFDQIDRMIFTIQWEVAQRFASKVGEKAYSKASVCAQFYCREIVLVGGKLSPAIFWPAPKVYSQTILFHPKKELPKVNYETFREIVRGGFGWRRKIFSKALLCACKGGSLKEKKIRQLLNYFPQVEKKRGEKLCYGEYEEMAKKYEDFV